MNRIAHVLCPVDFSEISQHALDHAAAIARWYEARLTVLYVFANLPTMDLPPLTLDESQRDRFTAELRQMAAGIVHDIPVEFRVQEAPYVHDEILAQAASSQADLLVVGTHGRSGFQKLFLGSVTEKVIRKATCPTLVVPPRAPGVAAGSPIRFRQILCAVDFSQSSLEALTSAINIAEEAGATVTVLHVLEIPPVFVGEPGVSVPDLSSLQDTSAANARRKLQELIPEQARAFCTVETAVVETRAYREILRQAAERESNLIVMGVQGRGALDLLVFGSTTHHVIRASACPILIVGRP